jgi:hypothetical protein
MGAISERCCLPSNFGITVRARRRQTLAAVGQQTPKCGLLRRHSGEAESGHDHAR